MDPDLLAVLELASEEELEALHDLLFRTRSLLGPLLKQHTAWDDERAPSTRPELLRHLGNRLLYLAADSKGTLRGRWPSYRQVLLGLRETLGVECPATLETPFLETVRGGGAWGCPACEVPLPLPLLLTHRAALLVHTVQEVFLAVLERHMDAVGGGGSAAAASAAAEAAFADGMAGGEAARRRPSLLQRLLAPLRVGGEEVLPVVAKASSAAALTRLSQGVLQRLGGQLVGQHIQAEAALQLVMRASSKGLAASLETRVAVQTAQRGLASAAGRYAGVRSVLGFLGPFLWASTAVDLFLLSVGADHQRVIRAVYLLAQIRLLRTGGFVSAPPADPL